MCIRDRSKLRLNRSKEFFEIVSLSQVTLIFQAN
jgi:hypothetical protein